MKKILIGLSALLMVTSAQANQRLAECIKQRSALRTSLDSVEAQLRTTETQLRQCQLSTPTPGPGNGEAVRRCRQELRQTREELRLCRLTSTPTPDFGEVARLREEVRRLKEDNRFLRENNDDLRFRLDECQRNTPPTPASNVFCTAACVKSDRITPDMRYLGGAEAYFELEAQNLANQEVRSQYNCSYGIVNVQCAPQGYENQNYCVAGCVNSDRTTVDMRYSKGASGRSEVEAGFNAMKEVKEAYNCSYGIKVSNCN